MTFWEYVDVMVAKAVMDVMVDVMVAMLAFIRRLLLEFRDSYTLKSLYTCLVCPKLEYASCVWSPFYDVRVDRVERVQRWFIRCMFLRVLG
jgi:hypothetical protein